MLKQQPKALYLTFFTSFTIQLPSIFNGLYLKFLV